jgi:uncharacterized protein (TIGR00251 family)
MIIEVKVFPRAKKNQIKEESGIYKIYTTAPAVDNKANSAVIKMLADFFSVRKNQVLIKKGGRAREKLVVIDK